MLAMSAIELTSQIQAHLHPLLQSLGRSALSKKEVFESETDPLRRG